MLKCNMEGCLCSHHLTKALPGEGRGGERRLNTKDIKHEDSEEEKNPKKCSTAVEDVVGAGYELTEHREDESSPTAHSLSSLNAS
jgi:hypothetical protein